jgi:signal transduction histidine kinase
VHVEPGFPLVACHGAYLRQIFDNLVANALKYPRPGEPPALTITSKTGQHMVCFAVQDRGIGIPIEQRQRVFQPFVRLHPSDTTGSGIGLAIVQRIVALYGGQVWIEGEEGEGCTVKFTVPWLRDDLAGDPAESSKIEVLDLPQNGWL